MCFSFPFSADSTDRFVSCNTDKHKSKVPAEIGTYVLRTQAQAQSQLQLQLHWHDIIETGMCQWGAHMEALLSTAVAMRNVSEQEMWKLKISCSLAERTTNWIAIKSSYAASEKYKKNLVKIPSCNSKNIFSTNFLILHAAHRAHLVHVHMWVHMWVSGANMYKDIPCKYECNWVCADNIDMDIDIPWSTSIDCT